MKFIGFINGYGCTLILEDNDIEIIYSHISPNYLVNKGDYVIRGDVVAKGGPKYINYNGEIITNGYTTGPHLHFEVRQLGDSIDPIMFLNSLEVKEN